MDDFYDKLREQLKRMTEQEKDAWILSQAKIFPEWKREDFYKSICGTKKVIDMPERDEITEFCRRVRDEEITVEYDTHYVEFDDFGHYHDDWEYDFYDPDGAMRFLSSVICGCHDLVVLEEYAQAFEILDEIIGIKFAIVDHPDTDDCCPDEFMDLDMAEREGMITLDRDELLRDYILACRNASLNTKQMAEKIASAFETELFEDCETHYCIALAENDPLLDELKSKLMQDLERYEKEHLERRKKEKNYWYEFSDIEKIEHIRALIDSLGKTGAENIDE